MANKILNNLLKLAAQEKAEKMIISSHKTDLSCFMQLPLGEEANFKLEPKLSQDLLANFRKLLKLAPEELTRNQYFKLQDKNFNLNFYLNILSGPHGEKIIMSLVQPRPDNINFNQLGWPIDIRQDVKKALTNKQGLIVIAASDQEGKSTTLRSCLSLLNREEKNIYLLSDSLTPELDNINQMSKQADSWDRLLKYDTDIIAVEAETDTKTLETAILAANTGRLIIVSIKAVNALEALFRLITLPLPISLIVDNLKLIIAQQLKPLKRVEQTSRKKNKRHKIAIFETLNLNQETKQFILDNYSEIRSTKFWQEFSRLSLNNGYTPLAIDEKQKKRAGLI